MSRLFFACATVVVLQLLAPMEAAAQDVGSVWSDKRSSAVTIASVRHTPALHLGQWISGPNHEPRVFGIGLVPSRPMPRLFARHDEQTITPSDRRTKTRTILGAIVGATGGFFAGGYTGAWIEGDSCHCDDPGLKGALIGAPIGAVAGGILGGLFLF